MSTYYTIRLKRVCDLTVNDIVRGSDITAHKINGQNVPAWVRVLEDATDDLAPGLDRAEQWPYVGLTREQHDEAHEFTTFVVFEIPEHDPRPNVAGGYLWAAFAYNPYDLVHVQAADNTPEG